MKKASMETNKNMKENIKHIIFDLGGVVLNIDFTKTIKAFVDLGIADFDQVFSQYKQNRFFDSLDKGIISSANFYNEMYRFLPSEITKDRILSAWNAMLLDFPSDRIQLIKKLRNNYNLFLLSNTNSLHYTVYQEKLRIKEQLELEDLFDKTYFSFKIGMRKPDKEIFEYVLKENNIEAKECLFIDDSKEHIETAEKLGIQCIHLVNRDLCSVFNTQDLSIIF